jgi:capsule polysaccharide modification protein KpsS
MRNLLFLAIFFSLLSCGSRKDIIDTNSDGYYQLQISPADGTKSLFVHINIPEMLADRELKQVMINTIEVPFIFNQQKGYVEVYIRDYPQANTKEEKESAALYQEITQKDYYNANLKIGAGYYIIPALKELESQELELVAPPR